MLQSNNSLQTLCGQRAKFLQKTSAGVTKLTDSSLGTVQTKNTSFKASQDESRSGSPLQETIYTR
jgi:hypothetical protein